MYRRTVIKANLYDTNHVQSIQVRCQSIGTFFTSKKIHFHNQPPCVEILRSRTVCQLTIDDVKNTWSEICLKETIYFSIAHIRPDGGKKFIDQDFDHTRVGLKKEYSDSIANFVSIKPFILILGMFPKLGWGLFNGTGTRLISFDNVKTRIWYRDNFITVEVRITLMSFQPSYLTLNYHRMHFKFDLPFRDIFSWYLCNHSWKMEKNIYKVFS